MFFQFRFGDHDVLATFSKPNYSEDIPPSLESYLSKLTHAASSQMERIHCFVPAAMLAMLHPYLLNLNRRQWQVLLSRIDLSTVVDKTMEA
nr:unnamed protein product [Haemonchus contortus]